MHQVSYLQSKEWIQPEAILQRRHGQGSAQRKKNRIAFRRQSKRKAGQGWGQLQYGTAAAWILTKDHTGALKKGVGIVDLIQQQSFECALLQLDGRAEVFQGRHCQQWVEAQQAHWLMVGRISLHYRTTPAC